MLVIGMNVVTLTEDEEYKPGIIVRNVLTIYMVDGVVVSETYERYEVILL